MKNQRHENGGSQRRQRKWANISENRGGGGVASAAAYRAENGESGSGG